MQTVSYAEKCMKCQTFFLENVRKIYCHLLNWHKGLQSSIMTGTVLEFYSLVNTVKTMLSHSVNQLTLFLGKLTDNCSSWISRRMTIEIISRSISTKVMWMIWDSNLQSLELQLDGLSAALWNPQSWSFQQSDGPPAALWNPQSWSVQHVYTMMSHNSRPKGYLNKILFLILHKSIFRPQFSTPPTEPGKC